MTNEWHHITKFLAAPLVMGEFFAMQVMARRFITSILQDIWKIRVQLTKPVTWPPLVWGVVCGAAASGNPLCIDAELWHKVIPFYIDYFSAIYQYLCKHDYYFLDYACILLFINNTNSLKPWILISTSYYSCVRLQIFAQLL